MSLMLAQRSSREQIFGRCFVLVLELNFLSTWGDKYYLGLTGLQLLGADDQVIDLTVDMLQVVIERERERERERE